MFFIYLFYWSMQKGKGWPLQLLSVACLSLAAKMEEISVPLLLDLQTKEPRFLFKPKTIQRMELMVMAILKWRLRSITPFDFVHHFISKLSCFGPQSEHQNHVVLISNTLDIIVLTCQGNILLSTVYKSHLFDTLYLSFPTQTV